METKLTKDAVGELKKRELKSEILSNLEWNDPLVALFKHRKFSITELEKMRDMIKKK